MAPSRTRLVYLLGFMGAGKSTVGSKLSAALRWPFVDLDTAIEAGQGMSIRQIFEQAGEPFFRTLEYAALSALVKSEPAVLALGGGTFAQDANLYLIRERGGSTVWLDCPPQELWRRCLHITNRPLFKDFASFEQLFHERMPYYQLAAHRVSTEGHTAEEVAEEILRLQLF